MTSETDGFYDYELLPPEEALDSDELGDESDELGYSPLDYRPADLRWGFTPWEARTPEPLVARLARELPDVADDSLGDGLGDSFDTDGELLDDQVGAHRAGRLAWSEPDNPDPAADYWGHDVGIDGGGASAEEAAVHVVADDAPSYSTQPGDG